MLVVTQQQKAMARRCRFTRENTVFSVFFPIDSTRTMAGIGPLECRGE